MEMVPSISAVAMSVTPHDALEVLEKRRMRRPHGSDPLAEMLGGIIFWTTETTTYKDYLYGSKSSLDLDVLDVLKLQLIKNGEGIHGSFGKNIKSKATLLVILKLGKYPDTVRHFIDTEFCPKPSTKAATKID